MHTVTDLVRVLDQEHPRPRGGVELRGALHDLGHGLATLSYLAEGMRDDPALSGDLRDRLDLMDEELGRLLRLVDLRMREPVTAVFDVRELLDRLVTLTAWSTSAPVTLRPGEPVWLHTDETLLWRMVTNLVDNAVRAVPANGLVELSAARGRAEVVVEVADDGPGLGHGPPGTGSLGTGIVAGLARMCGATLRVAPGTGGGTRAQLVFPDGD